MATIVLITLSVLVVCILLLYFCDETSLASAIGGVGAVVSAIALIVFVSLWMLRKDESISDRNRRTVIVTKSVTFVEQKSIDEDSCILKFTLDSVPYTFEADCHIFVRTFISSPKVDDVLEVKFVRPKKPDGKPEVLDVQNLTQEVERARSASPSTPEAPLTD